VSSRHPVDLEVVRRIAALARLELPEQELPLFAGQLARIVAYIDQLREIPETESADALPAGPTPVRSDKPRPGGGRAALEANAPRLLHDHVVVPRVVGGG
jgi:aspartyl-tRNA(Asn)/glutamyl-tRNA(Gln) amidotransferase subunit C